MLIYPVGSLLTILIFDAILISTSQKPTEVAINNTRDSGIWKHIYLSHSRSLSGS